MTGFAVPSVGDKALAIGGGALSLVMGIALAVTIIAKNSEIHTLQDSINHPVTGYADRLKQAQSDLTQCRANSITLEDATIRQNTAVANANAEGERRVTAVTQQLTVAKQSAKTAQAHAAAILAAKPGADKCTSADELILREIGK